MSDLDQELRAFELLQWVPFSLPSQFDEELAMQGHYSKLQAERSSAAIDAWDLGHQYERSAELAAFFELKKLKVYTEHVLFSPAKSKDGGYTRRLKEHDSRGSQGPSGPVEPARAARKRRTL